MTVKDILEACGHIFVVKPWLFSKNVELLANFGIDLKECKVGKGIQVLGYLNLEERLELIKEMGNREEILKNPEDALELIRGYSMSQNYNDYKDIGTSYVKGAA